MSDREAIAWILEFKRENGRWPGFDIVRKRLGFGYKRTKRLLRLAKEGAQTQPEAFLSETHVSPGYSVERMLVNKWGVPGAEQHQIKVWLSRSVDEEKLANALRQRLEEYPQVFARPDTEPGELFAVLSLPDLHVGMLAWHREAGENYDTEIAIARMKAVAADLLSRLGSYRVSQIVFPIGNDILHADTHDNTTTAGTRVDVDSRWQKAFTELAEHLIKGPLAWAAELAPVRVVVVPGNHDYQRAFYLGEVMRWYYEGRGLPVQVDNSPRTRKYIAWGKVLLGFTHGNGVRLNDLPLIMASEVPVEWGNSVWREWLLGHYHRRRDIAWNTTQEVGGVRLRVLPTLAPPDAWHYQRGFVGGVREGTLSIYSSTGLYAELYSR